LLIQTLLRFISHSLCETFHMSYHTTWHYFLFPLVSLSKILLYPILVIMKTIFTIHSNKYFRDPPPTKKRFPSISVFDPCTYSFHAKFSPSARRNMRGKKKVAKTPKIAQKKPLVFGCWWLNHSCACTFALTSTHLATCLLHHTVTSLSIPQKINPRHQHPISLLYHSACRRYNKYSYWVTFAGTTTIACHPGPNRKAIISQYAITVVFANVNPQRVV